MALMRLQKFLSAAGVCSRRQGEVYIKKGLVRVNGVVVTAMGTQVDPQKDKVVFEGRSVGVSEDMVYIALNKPVDYVTSCHQPTDKIVLDLVALKQRIYPVGRLDKDSTGLLLLTNDGRLHHRLSHPSFDHEKEYVVTTPRPIEDSALKRLASGLKLNGRKTRSAKVKRLAPDRFAITLKEGRNRQIRRMVGQVGHGVAALERVRIANVKLGRLKSGAWRHLEPPEVADLTRGLK
jgi:pseudouridine synthase